MTDQPEIIYNGDCPVCSHEINIYARYAKAEALPLTFSDLNSCDLDRLGLTEDAAARRLHLWHQGELLAGVPAFLVLWRHMPRYAWLARVVGLPGVFQIADFAYERIVAPIIYRRHLRRRALG